MTNMGVGSAIGTTTTSLDSGTGFDLNTVSSTLGNSLEATETQLDSFMQTMDPNNMDDILQLQMYMI